MSLNLRVEGMECLPVIDGPLIMSLLTRNMFRGFCSEESRFRISEAFVLTSEEGGSRKRGVGGAFLCSNPIAQRPTLALLSPVTGRTCDRSPFSAIY